MRIRLKQLTNKINQSGRILLCLVVATLIIIVYNSINENVLGQQEGGANELY